MAALLAVVVVAHAAPWIGGGFGYSLDGFNGAVWGQGARALVEDPVGSRLGGIQPDGHRYANHPPLTVWSAAVTSAIGGDDSVAVRLPAIVAAAVTPALLALLLTRSRVRPAAVIVGLVAGASSAMALTYGTMLDTPVVSLPAGLVALVVAQRVWAGDPPSTARLVGSAALAALAGWQALLLTVVATVVTVAVDRRSATRLGIGVAVGAGLTVAWAGWVHGSLAPLFGQAEVRSGGASPGPWSDTIADYLSDLFGPVLLALTLAGVVVTSVRLAVADGADPDGTDGEASGRRMAGVGPVALVLAVAIVGYTLVFRNGAAIHPYWTFWGVALVAVAVAALADAVLAVLTRVPGGRWLSGATALVAAVALLGAGLSRTSRAEQRIHDGLDVLVLLDEVPDADRPTDVAIGVRGDPGTSPWAEYAVDGRAARADSPAEIRRLEPDLPVIVVLAAPPSPALREVALGIEGRFALVRADELAELLGVD